MQKTFISKNDFDLLGFTKAILTSIMYFSPEDASEEGDPDLLIGANKKGDILFLGKYDLYTDDKLTIDVLKIELKKGF